MGLWCTNHTQIEAAVLPSLTKMQQAVDNSNLVEEINDQEQRCEYWNVVI